MHTGRRAGTAASAGNHLLHAQLLVLGAAVRAARRTLRVPIAERLDPGKARLGAPTMWLKITPAGIAEVNLLWGNNEGPHLRSYHVGLATLAETCQSVRNCLEEMVRASANEDPGARARALRKLASIGADLYYVLFDASRAEEREAPSIIKSWMAEQYASRDLTLRITGHPAIHIPWALVFEANAAAIPRDADTLDVFAGFWGLKYALSSTLSGYGQPQARLLRKRERSKLLSLVNRDAAEQLSEGLRSAYTELMSRPVGVAYDMESCLELIGKAVSYDTILHFFGHQSEGVLDLGNDETIGIVKFKMLLDMLTQQKDGSQSYSLVMLSACESATGKLDYSFTHASDRSGLCGVIGTEAVVPRDFAALFAIKFLTRMLGEGPVGR
jgi:hypothetical protein